MSDQIVRIYVGGTIGQVPTVATTLIEQALLQAASMHTTGEQYPADVVWACQFVDGEPEILRWTATAPDGAQLYVELMDVER